MHLLLLLIGSRNASPVATNVVVVGSRNVSPVATNVAVVRVLDITRFSKY